MTGFAEHDERTHRFPATRHSIVEALASDNPEAGREALGLLVSVYWKPVYGYLRLRWGLEPEAARDLTQDFFTEAMLRGFLGGYDPSRARFRTYLRSCLDHFAAKARRAERRLKRGGGARALPLDFDGAEAAFVRAGQIAEADAEARFRQEWVRALLTGAVEAFRAACEREGKATQFQLFARYDLSPEEASRPPTYRQLAEEFAVPVTQVTNYLAWARREFRRQVLQTLRGLCGSEAEFVAEARELLGVEAP